MLTTADSWGYPQQYVRQMLEILEAREPIDVQCPLFEMLSIDRISVDKWELPFTKGEQNQAYRINAYSDNDWSLLVKK